MSINCYMQLTGYKFLVSGLRVTFCSSRQVRDSAGRNMLKSTSVSGDINTPERTDGSQSDTALGTLGSSSKKRRSSLNARFVAIVGNRRSRSTSQISQTGQTFTSDFPSEAATLCWCQSFIDYVQTAKYVMKHQYCDK